MRAYQNVDGGFTFGVHEYDIAKTTAIKAGQVVKLSEGLVVAATAAETGAILGVAKENHSGAEDAINPRSNGTKILVYDDPGMIMRCKAPVMAATGGSATTFVSTELATLEDDDLNGGYIVLAEKGASSTNTDEIGSVRRITDFTATSNTLTTASGGTICEGDKYMIFPPLMFAKGNFDAGIQALVLTATEALPVKVVQIDLVHGEIGLVAKSHALR